MEYITLNRPNLSDIWDRKGNKRLSELVADLEQYYSDIQDVNSKLISENKALQKENLHLRETLQILTRPAINAK